MAGTISSDPDEHLIGPTLNYYNVVIRSFTIAARKSIAWVSASAARVILDYVRGMNRDAITFTIPINDVQVRALCVFNGGDVAIARSATPGISA